MVKFFIEKNPNNIINAVRKEKLPSRVVVLFLLRDFSSVVLTSDDFRSERRALNVRRGLLLLWDDVSAELVQYGCHTSDDVQSMRRELMDSAIRTGEGYII